MRPSLPAIFCVVLLAASCAEPAPRQGPTVGTVRDALDGSPLVGAIVRSGLVSATTDAQGHFLLSSTEGPIRASADGYLDLLRLPGGVDDALALWPTSPDDDAVDAHLAALEAARSARDDPDDPALSERARARLRGAPPALGNEPRGDIGVTRSALTAPPTTIRIWRRSIDGSSRSCSGRVDVIPLEEYVAGVLPSEWITSWHDESLRAGALAIRTYAWQWVRAGGKYDCADLDDTARSQVYRDERMERTTAAVSDTSGMAITVDGELVSGEYSAENGDPTAYGVADPLCAGFTIRGHRRGMCQWGSQRWSLDGRDHLWIAAHYFPGSIVEGGAPRADDYDARLELVEAPASMVSGEQVDVTFELENTGRREWTAEATRLVVSDTEPSPFFDEVSWIDALTATGPDAYRYAPGTNGRFTVRVEAPEVTDARLVEDQLRLTHEAFGPFGPVLTLSIQVTPVAGPPPPTPPIDGGATTVPPRPGSGGGLTGCSASPDRGSAGGLFALLALGLLSRRIWA